MGMFALLESLLVKAANGEHVAEPGPELEADLLCSWVCSTQQ